MKIIKNFADLAKTPGRADALTILEAGFRAINTKEVIRKAVHLTDHHLVIQGNNFNLAYYKRIFIVAIGKAGLDAAIALEEVLGDKIYRGVVLSNKTATFTRMQSFMMTHPLPSLSNTQATEELVNMLKETKEDDLIIAVISGGGSAMLCYPYALECQQGQELYEASIKYGINIYDLNLLRKHTSEVKGGGIAIAAYPATVVGLVFSDIPGDAAEIVASGPTYRDTTTIADAQKVADKYSIKKLQMRETVKDDKYFKKVTNILVASNILALEGMQQKAKELGYAADIWKADVNDTAQHFAQQFAAMGKKKSVVLAGGETVVHVDHPGRGGRNLNVALYSLPLLQEGQIVISAASDGRDNTDAVGAIADTIARDKAKDLHLDADKYLREGNSYIFFEELDDLIFTGVTGSNVSDIMLTLVE